MAGRTIQVTDSTFEDEVLSSPQPVLVDFGAVWCGPCRMAEPIIEQIANEQHGKLKVVLVDADASPRCTSAFEVMSLPTVLLVKNGTVVERLVGYTPKTQLMRALEPHLR